jgi:hypothetical protein
MADVVMVPVKKTMAEEMKERDDKIKEAKAVACGADESKGRIFDSLWWYLNRGFLNATPPGRALVNCIDKIFKKTPDVQGRSRLQVNGDAHYRLRYLSIVAACLLTISPGKVRCCISLSPVRREAFISEIVHLLSGMTVMQHLTISDGFMDGHNFTTFNNEPRGQVEIILCSISSALVCDLLLFDNYETVAVKPLPEGDSRRHVVLRFASKAQCVIFGVNRTRLPFALFCELAKYLNRNTASLRSAHVLLRLRRNPLYERKIWEHIRDFM